jgi:SAGA-associated factor 29
MRSLFPLPDLNADPRSPTHPNAYEDFPPGTRVLAIYPDTSSFYRGIVRHPPIPGTASGHPVPKATAGSLDGKYIVEFDDDNNQQQIVNWDVVFEVSRPFASVKRIDQARHPQMPNA